MVVEQHRLFDDIFNILITEQSLLGSIHDIINKKNLYLFVDYNNYLKGFMIIEIHKSIIFLHKLYIMPKCRGKGYANNYLSYLDILSEGEKKIVLDVYTENTKAINLYTSNGYSLVSKLYDTYLKKNYYIMKK